MLHLELACRGRSQRRSLDVYKLAEALSDMVWHGFDKWNKSMVTVHGCRLYSLRVKRKKSIREL